MKKQSFYLLLLCIAFLLTGCGVCKVKDIEVMKSSNKRDVLLNCEELDFEILTAKFELQSNMEKKNALPSYAGSPVCIPDALLLVEKAETAARNRIEYLNMLKVRKKCTSSPQNNITN